MILSVRAQAPLIIGNSHDINIEVERQTLNVLMCLLIQAGVFVELKPHIYEFGSE